MIFSSLLILPFFCSPLCFSLCTFSFRITSIASLICAYFIKKWKHLYVVHVEWDKTQNESGNWMEYFCQLSLRRCMDELDVDFFLYSALLSFAFFSGMCMRDFRIKGKSTNVCVCLGCECRKFAIHLLCAAN